MIFDAGSLSRVVAAHAAAEHVPMPVSNATMRAIVSEAERLAGGRVGDEPAALFYACARRARLFGRIASRFLDAVGRAQAIAIGLELDATELDIVLMRGRISFGAADWNEVRETFARWHHRVGEPARRAPPKRQR
jgi:hypothetical protein